MARRRTSLIAALAVLAAGTASGCTSPRALAALNEQLNQAADAVYDIRMNLSYMQGTIDSLRTVVARQDTLITRLANAAGIQILK
jgi:hypothetical protein